MRMYTKKHKFTCGIDLHSRVLYLCILDGENDVRLHRQIPASTTALLAALAPYREDLVIGVESTFNWYWLADWCAEQDIDFVLGHALYMRAVHGPKVKNDRVDSRRIAGLLQSGMFPLAYVYPKAWRATRDLLRRRTFFMRKRAELLGHTQLCRLQYNLPEFEKRIDRKSNRDTVADVFSFEPSLAASVEANMQLVQHYDEILNRLELAIKHHARDHQARLYYLLQTIPGIGPILGLNILYEVGDIHRFASPGDFVSYARLIRPKKTSAGKVVAPPAGKMGNAQLKWTFNEAACGFPRYNNWGKHYTARLKKKYGNAKALAVLAHKLGRCAYYVMTRETPFDKARFER